MNKKMERIGAENLPPEDRRYTNEHEWIIVDGEIGTVGITDFAQSHLGDVVYIGLPAVDTLVMQMGQLAEVESVKAVSEVYSPLSGEIVEVNVSLQDSPELINKDPYNEGWIARIRIKKPSELDNLMNAQQYHSFIEAQEEH